LELAERIAAVAEKLLKGMTVVAVGRARTDGEASDFCAGAG